MKGKKDINDFFKDGVGDFRMEPPKKVRRKLLLVLLLGKLVSGYRKYVIGLILAIAAASLLFTETQDGVGVGKLVDQVELERNKVESLKDKGLQGKEIGKNITINDEREVASVNELWAMNKVKGREVTRGSIEIDSHSEMVAKATKNNENSMGRLKQKKPIRASSKESVDNQEEAKEENENKGTFTFIDSNDATITKKEGLAEDNEEKSILFGDGINDSEVDSSYGFSSQSKVTDTIFNKLNELRVDSGIMPDSLSLFAVKSDSVFSDTTVIDTNSNSIKKLSFMAGTYFSMEMALKKVDYEFYHPAFSYGFLGAVSYKNNLLYLGVGYRTQVHNLTYDYSFSEDDQNITSRYVVKEIQKESVDSTMYADTTNGQVVVIYDTTYTTVLDSSTISDTTLITKSSQNVATQRYLYSYVSMPLYVAHKFNFGKHGLELSAGITVNILVSNKHKGSTYRLKNSAVPENIIYDPVRLYFDYRIGLGYFYQMTSKIELNAEVNYRQVNRNPYPINSTKINYLGGVLGVRLKLN